jgi:hypothetical protein
MVTGCNETKYRHRPSGGRWGVSAECEHGYGNEWCPHCRILFLEQRLSAAEAELEKLRGMKAPTGNLSHDQQARAWSYVWTELWDKTGLGWFVPEPLLGPSQQKVVQYVLRLQSLLLECMPQIESMMPEDTGPPFPSPDIFLDCDDMNFAIICDLYNRVKRSVKSRSMGESNEQPRESEERDRAVE